MIDDIVKPYLDNKVYSGAILVSHKGNIGVREAFGHANQSHQVLNQPTTKFHIASVSKPFTSVAILQLVEGGNIDLEDTIESYVPDLEMSEKITISNLLRHYSGIPNINSTIEYPTFLKFGASLETLIEYISTFTPNYEPGTSYQYSNSNYNILAYIIEQTSNLTYGEYLEKCICKPLSLINTYHHDDNKDIIHNLAEGYDVKLIRELQHAEWINWKTKIGNGSLVSTVDDLHTFFRALRETQIVSCKTYLSMVEKSMGLFRGTFNGHAMSYINGRSPGYTARYTHFIDDDLSIIVLSNNYTANVVDEITYKIAGKFLGIDVTYDPIPQYVAQKAAVLEKYTEHYEFEEESFSPGLRIEILSDGTYWYYKNSSGTSILYPTGPNSCFSIAYWCKAGFEEGRFYFELSGTKHFAKRVTETL